MGEGDLGDLLGNITKRAAELHKLVYRFSQFWSGRTEQMTTDIILWTQAETYKRLNL
jgi:hypothetical protein